MRSKNEEKFLSFFLYICMKAKQDEIYMRQQGTCQPHIYINHIQSFPIPVMSLAEQRKFVAKTLKASRLLKEAEKDKARAEEDTCGQMSKLFKGEK